MGLMATQKYDNVSNFLGDSQWWKYGGGGTTGGAGAAIGGAALGLGTLLVNGITGNKGTGGVKFPGLEEQEATQKPEPGQVINEPVQAVNDLGEVAQPQIPKAQLPKEELTGLTKPEIEDKTNENVELAISNTDALEMLKGLRDEQWAREDSIREQTRYDQQHAFSYAIEDMRRAGVNPNLVGVSPAASGGGITQATGVNLGLLETELNNEGQALIAMLNNYEKGNIAEKDRIVEVITSLVQIAGQIGLGLAINKK